MNLAWIIHHIRSAWLGIPHYSAFASLTNTESIRSVIENAVMTTTVAIRSLSGELSRVVTENAVITTTVAIRSLSGKLSWVGSTNYLGRIVKLIRNLGF